jgi:DNA-binding NarL/FixJ family response regulator
MPLRIALIDDHVLFRQGLRAILGSHADLEVVLEASDARLALPALESAAPDVIVVDVTLRESSRVEATQEILRRCPESKVLVLSMHVSEDVAAEAFVAGAAGYALKDQDAAQVLEAIRAVAAGKRYLAPRLPAAVLARRRASGPLAHLSRREREVFDLVVKSRSNRDIAGHLCISVKTVETHRTSINRKLGAHSTADLVRIAARLGLLD